MGKVVSTLDWITPVYSGSYGLNTMYVYTGVSMLLDTHVDSGNIIQDSHSID